MNKVKITVLKTTFDKEIASKYAKPELGPCSRFQEVQVFIGGINKPEVFCDTAWNCIYQYVFALTNEAVKTLLDTRTFPPRSISIRM